MRKTTGLILGLMLAVTTAAHAEMSKESKEAAQKALPQTRVDEVRESPIPGLYEVIADRNILYLSSDQRYLLIGEIYDLKTGKNITTERRMEVSKVDWKSLTLDLAIKFGQSDKKKLALFIDPDCPYCVKAYDAVKNLKDVESYVFLYPLPSHKEAREKCELVMCAEDKNAALDKVMHGEKPGGVTRNAACLAKLNQTIQAAANLRLAGTPTFVFFPTGQMIPGFVPPEHIENFLQTEGNKHVN